jgi:hypothetical protein
LLKSRVALAKLLLAEARAALETALAEYPGDLGTFHGRRSERRLWSLVAVLRVPVTENPIAGSWVVRSREFRHVLWAVFSRCALRSAESNLG